VVRDCGDFEAVTLEVSIGGFTMGVRVLNIDRRSPLTGKAPTSEGAYGKVHALEFLGEQIVVKSHYFGSVEPKIAGKTIAAVMKEYCITRISDWVGSGPTLKNWFGFDLIVWNNSIDFALERCDPLPKYADSFRESLLASLASLHRFRIVHRDINPANVMFSPTKHKLVFIDFGFADIVQEGVGFKSLTSFHGTPTFVSKEMLKLFSVELVMDYVDLYYNDLVGLERTFEDLQQDTSSRTAQQAQQ
jgi:serine/threonine protein kinase